MPQVPYTPAAGLPYASVTDRPVNSPHCSQCLPGWYSKRPAVFLLHHPPAPRPLLPAPEDALLTALQFPPTRSGIHEPLPGNHSVPGIQSCHPAATAPDPRFCTSGFPLLQRTGREENAPLSYPADADIHATPGRRQCATHLLCLLPLAAVHDPVRKSACH